MDRIAKRNCELRRSHRASVDRIHCRVDRTFSGSVRDNRRSLFAGCDDLGLLGRLTEAGSLVAASGGRFGAGAVLINSTGIQHKNIVRNSASSRTRIPSSFALPNLEIARVLVRFDDIASFIVNANHCATGSAAKLCVLVALLGCIRCSVHSNKTDADDLAEMRR